MTEDDEGKVVWPIPEDGISYLDAMATLCEIAEGALDLSHYAENGNDFSGTLSISLFGPNNHFFEKPLKEALEDGLDQPADFNILDEMECTHWLTKRSDEQNAAREKSERLRVRLLRAYHEWEANEAAWTFDEIRERPLPAGTP